MNVGLSFLRGMVATVNPCWFILLPTYLMYFLGLQGQLPGSQRATIRRALVVSGAVSAGFLTVFLVAGLVSVHFTQWINRNARYATVVIQAMQLGEHAPHESWTPDPTPENSVAFRIVNPRAAPVGYADWIRSQCGHICRGF